VMVTDRLTSPAVAGVLLPVLILPGSLLTALTPEQLRFILLHELAHIRRGDYLVNLCQLLVEALLFFNPAVWWLSRQIRLEREACCDAVAIERSGAPTEYARTLLHVAERYAQGEPTAALAFGDRREPSGLAERIQRLLSPNHRSHLRLTWRAMAGSLLVGCGLLALMAVGTRVTVAAILTPQERMDRIQKVLVEHGEDVSPTVNNPAREHFMLTGRVRTADGSPLAKNLVLYSFLQTANNSSIGSAFQTAKDGSFKDGCQRGRLTLSVEVPGYAPCVIGPLTVKDSNSVNGIEMVVERGFAVTVQMVDADSGVALSQAQVTADFTAQNHNLAERKLTTDLQGNAVMTNCANLAMDLTGCADGYELVQESFTSLAPDQTLRLATRRGLATSGLVLDKATGQPLAGATLQVLRQQGASDDRFDWDYRPLVLTTSDSAGHFATAALRSDSRYRLGVGLPGHESMVFEGVWAGETNLVARLGPELIVHGRVTGKSDWVINRQDRACFNYYLVDPENNNSLNGQQVYGRVTNGVCFFDYTNRVAGEVVVFGHRRRVDAPIADWLIELTNPPVNLPPPQMRDVVVRLKAASGIPPRGTINFSVVAKPNNVQNIAYDTNAPLQDGAARVAVPVGSNIEYAPDKNTVGYWFPSGFNWTNVAAGNGPQVIDVPVIPAGVIAAHARNADGTPAGGLMFSILVLKPSPAAGGGFNNYDRSDSYSGNGPRQYVTGPLPLGGTYEILGWRDSSFCSSGPIELTEAAPDRVVELQFAPGQDLTGRVLLPDGRPARGASAGLEASVNAHGFGGKSVLTDANGEFRLTGCTPEIAKYTLIVSQPGCAAVMVPVDFKRLPLTVALKPGLKLAGRVVETATGRAIPNAQVQAVAPGGPWAPVTTRTDAGGNYEFNTLGEATYNIYVMGGQFGPTDDHLFHQKDFRAGVVTNLLLEVTPYPGGQLAE